MQDVLSVIIYVFVVVVIAFGTSGATYFWSIRSEKRKQNIENEKLINDMKYIREKFKLVEACQRDIATLQLISDTNKYALKGSIPMHIKTLMLNICGTLKKQGANGDVTQCRCTLESLPIDRGN